MKNEDLAKLVPSLIVMRWSDPNRNVRGDIIDMRITGRGDPLCNETDTILSRWETTLGQLMVTMDDQGKGPRSGADGPLRLAPVAEGTIKLAIAETRLLGVVREGMSRWGELDYQNPRRVVPFVWEYRDIETIETSIKTKAFGGGERVDAVDVLSIEPPAQLRFENAFPLNASWRHESFVAKTDLATFGASLVAATTAYRLGLAETDEERTRLQSVQAGARVQDGSSRVAWLVDPAS